LREHQPPQWLIALLGAFFWAVALAALAFWVVSLAWTNGPAGLIRNLGPSPVSLLTALHAPAGIAGLLLWHWRRPQMPPRRRVLHETATVYFGAAVAVGMVGNFAAMVVLDAS
jgi:vacuolar-type H+-ATPase subunit I/STV1